MNTCQRIKIFGSKFCNYKILNLIILFSLILFTHNYIVGCSNNNQSKNNTNEDNQEIIIISSKSTTLNNDTKNFKILKVKTFNLKDFPPLLKIISKIKMQIDTTYNASKHHIYLYAIINKDSIDNSYFDIEITPYQYDFDSKIIEIERSDQHTPAINCITYLDSMPIVISADSLFYNNVLGSESELFDSIKIQINKYNKLTPVAVDGCPPSWNCKFNKKSIAWIRMYNGFIWLRYVPRKDYQRISKAINDSLKTLLERFITEHGEPPIWQNISAKDYITIMPDE